MKHFTYSRQAYRAPKSALGLIVLQSDEVMEHEVRRQLPEDVPLYHTRIPSGLEVTEETLSQMEAQIPVVTELLPAEGDIGVVAYGCTSGTTVIGEANVAKAVQSVLPNVQVTNPLTAVKARLRSLGAKRIGLLTPYVPEVSQAMMDHLTGEGFEITSSGSFFEVEEKNVTRISRQSILDALLEVGRGECDAVFASCTNLRTLDVYEEAEKELGKPVISSNSSLAWHMLELRKQLDDLNQG